MLDMDVSDVKGYHTLTKNEAREFLKAGVHVICQVQTREFQELFDTRDLDTVLNLEEQKVYSNPKFYIT